MPDPEDLDRTAPTPGPAIDPPKPCLKCWIAGLVLIAAGAYVVISKPWEPPVLPEGVFRIQEEVCIDSSSSPEPIFKVNDEINYATWEMKRNGEVIHTNLGQKSEDADAKYAVLPNGEENLCLYMKKKDPIVGHPDQEYFLMIEHTDAQGICITGWPISHGAANLVIAGLCETSHAGAWTGGP